MASSRSSSHPEPPIVQQIVTEFFAKSVHIILQSRSPHVSSRYRGGNRFASSPSSPCSLSGSRRDDRWFNLALPDCPAALENFDIWQQSNFEPLVIDIVLMHRTLVPDKEQFLPGGCLVRNLSGEDQYQNRTAELDGLQQSERETIVERWTVQYESRESSSCYFHSSETSKFHKRIYKRLVVLLRTLYSFVRLLPAYRLFCEINFSCQIYPLCLSHRISSFVEPFTRTEDAKMKHFAFMPIDTPCGRLNISVSYLPTLGDMRLEPFTALSTELIPDYVGSPTTQPHKRFQLLPSLPPVYVSVTRRRSLSNDPVSSSPSPTYYDSRALQPCIPLCGHMHADSLSGCSLPSNASALHKKNTSPDEYKSSPPFSLPSPSPSAQISGGSSPSALLRVKNVPVSLLSSRPGRTSILPPSPPKSTKHTFPSQDDNPGVRVMISSPDSKLQIKKALFKLGMLQTGTALQKLVYLWKDNVGQLTGLSTSQRIIYGSSSRVPPSDEIDESMVVYPFAEDDGNFIDVCNRIKISELKGQEDENLEARTSLAVRSPESAVGAFVRILRTAPPLRQDFSKRSSQVLGEKTHFQSIKENKDQEFGMEKFDKLLSTPKITAFGPPKSRTVSDALEELSKYREMGDLLVRQGRSQPATVKSEESEEKSAGEFSQANDD